MEDIQGISAYPCCESEILNWVVLTRLLSACGAVCDSCSEDNLQHYASHLSATIYVRRYRRSTVQSKAISSSLPVVLK